MRRISIVDKGREPVVMVEGMPREYSLYHLAKDLDARLYLLEYDEEQNRFGLHIGKRALTPATIRNAMMAKDIDSRILYIEHEGEYGHFLFTDAGDTSAFYTTDAHGGIIGSRSLHTILPYRPRDARFNDIEYRDHRPRWSLEELRRLER